MITIVVGKPGAGKSYDTVSRLAEDLIDRINRNAELPTIVTNLKLNLDAFNAYIVKQTRKDVEIDLVTLTDDDLSVYCWWRNLPDNSRIILDESQFFWSSHKIDQAEQQNLIETLSTHRHRRQDFILLTQSLTSLSVDIRKYAESVIEVLNAKSLTLPFPISIPLRDIQTLCYAFGNRRQIYRTREGLLEGTYKVAWEGELKVCHTSPRIYELYRSTDSKQSGDNVLPFATGPGMWRRGLKWFLYKHGFAICAKLMIVIVPLCFIYLKLHKKTSVSSLLSPPPVAENVEYDSYLDDNISADMEISANKSTIIGQGWRLKDGVIVDDSSANPRGL